MYVDSYISHRLSSAKSDPFVQLAICKWTGRCYLICLITCDLIQISVETHADPRSVFSVIDVITFSTYAHLTGMARRRVPRVLALVKPTRRLLLYCTSCVEPIDSSHQLTFTSAQQEPGRKAELGKGEDGAVRSVICH